jgi:hypothetical protein
MKQELDTLIESVRYALEVYGVTGFPPNDGCLADVFHKLNDYDKSLPSPDPDREQRLERELAEAQAKIADYE